MRCPKCGYLSFDHIDKCLKCNKDISKVGAEYEGTTYNVAAPSFLKFTPKESQDDEAETDLAFGDSLSSDEVTDPDLDVLMNDEEDVSDEAEFSFDGDDFDQFEDQGEEEVEISFDEDDEGGMDLGQFEDAFEEQEPEDDGGVEMDFPDELADISDLSGPESSAEAPAAELQPEQPVAQEAPIDGNELDEFGLSLDLEELGDEFSLSEEESTKEPAPSSTGPGLSDLSIDDIGLSEDSSKSESDSEGDSMDMDADLDFDLDLGGLSLDNDL